MATIIALGSLIIAGISLAVNIGSSDTAAEAAEASEEAAEMSIEESIAAYHSSIADIKAQSADVSAEATRMIGAKKGEGILSLKEQGAQAAFEGKMAMTQAEMVASSEEAKLGASGVRSKGSPLFAAQQNADFAAAAADRTIQKGSTGMALGGVRLKTGLADIGAQETMLTREYTRRQKEMERRLAELQAYIGGEGGTISEEEIERRRARRQERRSNIDPDRPFVYKKPEFVL